ncbi:MAG: PEGA domain-containing protein [Methanobacteriota archaeon]
MIQKHLGITLALIGCLFLSGMASAVTIQTTGVSISGPGQKADIPVTIDAVPLGLAGYKMNVALSHPGIAKISAITLPEWAALKNIDGTLPAEAATLTAVDLMDNVKAGATSVPVATFSIEGISAGTTDLVLTITELTDDSGNPVQFTLTPTGITVGGSNSTPVVTATQTTVPPTAGPTITPTTVPTLEPTTIPTTSPTSDINRSEVVAPLATPTPVPTVVADFRADVTSGPAPMTVSFTDLSSGYPGTFTWNFGDSSSDVSSVVENPQHTYKTPGIYNVSLNASNSQYTNSTSKTGYVIVASMRMPQRGEKTAMQIFSVPEGAECYLNNVYQGLTPVNITNLTPRFYQLRLHKEGYYDVVDPVIANNGVLPTFVSGYEMAPHYAEIGELVADPPQTGAAYIVTYPELVTAFIDDKRVGKTDVMVMNLAVGFHNLTLVKEGYANWTDTLDVRNGLGVIQTYTYEQPYYPPMKTTAYVDMNA